MGAHRFITNNSADFGAPIKEIDVIFPACLPEAGLPEADLPAEAR